MDTGGTGNVAYSGGITNQPSTFSFTQPTMANVIKQLVKIADKLDKEELFDEANEIDEIIIEIVPLDNKPRMFSKEKEKEREERRKECPMKKLKEKLEENEEEGENVDMIAGVNGTMGQSAVHNQNVGNFGGFTENSFYGGYEQLEPPFKW